MNVLLHASITLEGVDLEAGNVVELSEKSAQALINEGNAVESSPEGEPIEKEDAADPVAQYQPEAALEKTRKALDDQYKMEELKPAAKEAGVDFAYDVTKANLIAAIIEQGKAEALLK